MVRAGSAVSTRRAAPNVMGIYLNDHLAGATAGTELARRVAGSAQDREEHATLDALAAEVAQDTADTAKNVGQSVARGTKEAVDTAADALTVAGESPWPLSNLRSMVRLPLPPAF